MNKQRILIMMPHPDDEALTASGFILHNLMVENEVFVALATNGDYLASNHEKGVQRLTESYRALCRLGVLPQNIFFMGYPDTGFDPQDSFIEAMLHGSNDVIVTPGGCETYGLPGQKKDFASEAFGSPALYSRSFFERDLCEILRITAPTLIITTDPDDMHGDHSALYHWVFMLSRRVISCPTIWTALVHSPDGDETWPNPEKDYFTSPQKFSSANPSLWAQRLRFPLPQGMTIDNKLDILSSYETALSKDEPQVCAYLLSFAKGEEIFFRR